MTLDGKLGNILGAAKRIKAALDDVLGKHAENDRPTYRIKIEDTLENDGGHRVATISGENLSLEDLQAFKSQFLDPADETIKFDPELANPGVDGRAREEIAKAQGTPHGLENLKVRAGIDDTPDAAETDPNGAAPDLDTDG